MGVTHETFFETKFLDQVTEDLVTLDSSLGESVWDQIITQINTEFIYSQRVVVPDNQKLLSGTSPRELSGS